MHRRERGFILVAALWLLAALSALAAAYAVYALESAAGSALPEERLRAEAALRAGVELCAYRQLSWPKAARPHAGAFSTQVGAVRIDAVYRSESARIDLNAAPRAVLAGLFVQLGASAQFAEYVAERIGARRARLKESERQKEAAIYAKAGLAYGPPGAPFDNTLEIALLPGVTPALAERALPYLTVFGDSKIDPAVAEPVVLAALPGATPALVQGLLGARAKASSEPAALARLAVPIKDFVTAEANDSIRAEVVATLQNRRIRAEIVLKIKDDATTPYAILYWRDDFDGGGV